ncbi:hypothetical protein ACF0H5_013657 [Mactra antiquata]
MDLTICILDKAGTITCMASLIIASVCLSLAFAAPSINEHKTASNTEDVTFLMPGVQPKIEDTYLCIPMKTSDIPRYIVGFQPHANMEISHHMLLYGCETPGSDQPVWNCGEMATKGGDYHKGPVCGSGAKILYAWAMDAPALSLPKDVGFKVGDDTGVNYLVLQVHYKNVKPFLPPRNEKDSSGIVLSMTNVPQARRAGVYLLGTSGYIPSKTTTYMETMCTFDNDFNVHPFAFRTHAHMLGQVTSGYRIRDGQWTEIGRKSPQLPQMFYNATTPGLVIQKGDILAARCTMKNNLDRDVMIGSTQNDEMCNFYMMYYTEGGDKIMPETYCFSAGPPQYYWQKDARMEDSLPNRPSTISVVPGTDEVLMQNAEPGLYADENKSGEQYEAIYDVKGADMNLDPSVLDPLELDRLLEYLKSRGPRAYDEDYY